MWWDRVLEEVRAAREAHAARFAFDLQAIVEDLRRRESTSGHPVVQTSKAHDDPAAAPSPALPQTPRNAGALVS